MLQLPLYHYVLLGLLIGLVLAGYVQPWIRFLMILGSALWLMDEYQFFSDTPGHFHLSGPVWIYLLLGSLIGAAGWHWGRLRGLQHLGQHELRTRWGYVRGISRY